MFMPNAKATAVWEKHFLRYLELGTPIPSTILQRHEDSMEVPYVQVTLTALDQQNEINRHFRLDAVNGSITVGRASTRESRADSALADNCNLKSPIVSRIHARFVIGNRANPLRLVDEGSTHGTFVNETKLKAREEIDLGHGSMVRFGDRIIHGTSNYPPTTFRVTFVWHDPVIPSFLTALRGNLDFRLPSPEEVSDAEEDINPLVDEQTPYPSSPSVVEVDNIPVCIDLTKDAVGDSENHSVEQDVVPNTANQEVGSAGSLWMNNSQENDSIVRETNLASTATTRRSYRFDYADSNSEDESLESTSQSSPPPRVYDDLYDDSDMSDTQSSQESSYGKKTKLEEVKVKNQKTNNPQNEVKRIVFSPESPGDNSLEIADINPTNESSEESTHSLIDVNDSTSYEQSLQWLGAGKHYDAKSIIQLYKEKARGGPDLELIALECVQVIAEKTSDDTLALALDHWIQYQKLPKDDHWTPPRSLSEDEAEPESESESEDFEVSSTCSEPAESQAELPTAVMELPSVPDLPPISRSNHIDQPKLSGCESAPIARTPLKIHQFQYTDSLLPHPINTIDFQMAYTGGPLLPGTDSQPSPVMRISNLVDSIPAVQSMSIPGPSQTKTRTCYQYMGPCEMPSGLEIDAEFKRIDTEFKGIDTEFKRIDTEFKELEDWFDNTDVELSNVDSTICDKQDWLEVEKKDLSPKLQSRSTGQKRKLSETDLERDEYEPSAILSELPLSSEPKSSPENILHDAQQSSLPLASDIANSLQTLTEDVVEMVEPERGQPQRQKRKINNETRHGTSLIKTITTHCIAGAIGAIGLVAAIVATTPAQLKEEIFYQME